jgi:mannose-6-phosphate isomerase
MQFTAPIRLSCSIKRSSWGKYAPHSLVAALSGSTDLGEKVPCAELWVGAHSSLPALVEQSGNTIELDELISLYPAEVLGQTVASRFGSELPFLLKVLSIRQPLSIQIHPDKNQAEHLHQTSPQWYPDSNHKFEIAIAVSEVEMLIGVRPAAQVREAFSKVVELRTLILGEQESLLSEDDDELFLKEVFKRVLFAPEQRISELCSALFNRLRVLGRVSPEERWILRLSTEFPQGDVGVFLFFLMNRLTLLPRSAVFIEPNTLHAYLSGDLVECLSNSDNVVRAGLTSKHIDRDSLFRMLDFSKTHFEAILPRMMEDGTEEYPSVADEFILSCASANTSECLNTKGRVELLFSLDAVGRIIVNGLDYPLEAGSALLLPAAITSYSLAIESGQLYRVRLP